MCRLQHYLTSTLSKEISCSPANVNVWYWGFKTEVCRKHYDLAVKLFESDATTLPRILDDDGKIRPGMAHVATHVFDPLYLADYIKLLALMQTTTVVMDCMRALAKELARTILLQMQTPDDLDDRFHTVKKEGREYIRISRALSYYEQFCFFPSNHVVFSGTLASHHFEWALQQGLMPKDPGAGYVHGDFSHRLQWHAVLRIATKQFTVPKAEGWNKTPLDLFTSLGVGAPKNRNLWGVIFDAQGRPNYSDPRTLLEDARQETENVLGKRLIKSFTKREDVEKACRVALEETIKDFLPVRAREYVAHLWRTPPQRSGLSPPVAAEVANVVYHWKKLGNPVAPAFDPKVCPIRPPLGKPVPPPAQASIYDYDDNRASWQTYFSKVTQLAAYEFWKKHINDNLSDSGKFLRGSRHNSYQNETDRGNLVEGVVVSLDSDRLVAYDINRRIRASYEGFNNYMTYSEDAGCRKRI